MLVRRYATGSSCSSIVVERTIIARSQWLTNGERSRKRAEIWQGESMRAASIEPEAAGAARPIHRIRGSTRRKYVARMALICAGLVQGPRILKQSAVEMLDEARRSAGGSPGGVPVGRPRYSGSSGEREAGSRCSSPGCAPNLFLRVCRAPSRQSSPASLDENRKKSPQLAGPRAHGSALSRTRNTAACLCWQLARSLCSVLSQSCSPDGPARSLCSVKRCFHPAAQLPSRASLFNSSLTSPHHQTSRHRDARRPPAPWPRSSTAARAARLPRPPALAMPSRWVLAVLPTIRAFEGEYSIASPPA